MFWMQMPWTIGFLGIMLVINICKIVRAVIEGSSVDSYCGAVFVATNTHRKKDFPAHFSKIYNVTKGESYETTRGKTH
ncbi:hypothetical protein KFZ58_01015 [Virgibacillus sp. NKC19-16]|uniref:hypothetical protein n=1 Tax=Virgibacillus salidurans TaxID=2831673 RepID=UPI001F2AD22F|nr:hypothetical protein [Virgibacillus sp. NKC19-16]UJL46584.1 hypothetical protein KFZ58_01015 [Virgibacillus sp. NKC19-16]